MEVEDSMDEDLNPSKIFEPIQFIFFSFIKLIYNLIQFSYINGKIEEIFAYISITERLLNYSSYLVNLLILPIVQKIFLFKVKFYLSNDDFLNGRQLIENIINMCSKKLMYMVEYDLDLENLEEIIKDEDNPYHLNKMKKIIIEDIIINISIAFYFRGILSEHLGKVVKALESYKQCKFFASKFLQKKSKFANFLQNLQINGIIYCSTMEELKEFKENKKLEKIEKQKKIIRKKLLENEKYQKNYDKYYTNIRANQNLYKGELKIFLDKAGEALYKDEKSRYSILAKFKKSDYIISTLKMINNLLSKDFKPVVDKMNKVEVTKPPLRIKEMISRSLQRKNHILFLKQEKKKLGNKSNCDREIYIQIVPIPKKK